MEKTNVHVKTPMVEDALIKVIDNNTKFSLDKAFGER